MIFFFFFKQKTAYEMRISDWSSDVCSSDLADLRRLQRTRFVHRRGHIEPPARARLGSAYHRADPQNHLDERRDDRTPAAARLRGKGRCEIGRESCRERGCQYV